MPTSRGKNKQRCACFSDVKATKSIFFMQREDKSRFNNKYGKGEMGKKNLNRFTTQDDKQK